MKREWTCAEVRLQLAAYREGWLPPDQAHTVAEHLRHCERCAQEAEMDAVLVSSLDAIRDEPLPESVPAPVSTAARSRRPVWGIVWATGAMTAILATGLSLMNSRPSDPTVADSGRVAAEVQTPVEAFSEAHFALAASDVGGDPNRAVLLGGLARKDKERTR